MIPDFQQRATADGLHRGEVEILQVNVGKVCNQTCSHCHVDAGPRRSEDMTPETARAAMALLDRFPHVHTVDITGGAPELNSNFRWMAEHARTRGLEVIDRCNLTVLFEPGQEDLADFLATNSIRIVASLPCYLEDNVDKQRGRGVYEKSIRALRLLNERGYGRGTGLSLDLVYNPVGFGLPPAQGALEADYKRRLLEDWGIVFDSLITITNMPISRFEKFLRASGQYDAYLGKLADNYNPATVPALMCRNTLSISWDGFVYDCDFNQMLDMKLGGGEPLRVENLTPESFREHAILTGAHCYGCTAGAGSSCGGALLSAPQG